jgi:hypothetical protein
MGDRAPAYVQPRFVAPPRPVAPSRVGVRPRLVAPSRLAVRPGNGRARRVPHRFSGGGVESPRPRGTPVGNQCHTTSPVGNRSPTTSPVGNQCHTTSPVGNRCHTTSPVGIQCHTTSPVGNRPGAPSLQRWGSRILPLGRRKGIHRLRRLTQIEDAGWGSRIREATRDTGWKPVPHHITGWKPVPHHITGWKRVPHRITGWKPVPHGGWPTASAAGESNPPTGEKRIHPQITQIDAD